MSASGSAPDAVSPGTDSDLAGQPADAGGFLVDRSGLNTFSVARYSPDSIRPAASGRITTIILAGGQRCVSYRA